MRTLLSSLLLSVPVALSSASHAAEEVNFILPSFKPYTYFEEGEFKGIGVEKIRKIFTQLDIPYTLVMAPNYGRAVVELKQARVDGLFLASENDERNAVAVFSEPIMINRWSWFIRKGSPIRPNTGEFRNQAAIATHLKTNTHKWLLKNGYNVTFAPSDTLALPKTLYNNRVNAVFLAEVVFKASAASLGIDESAFEQIVEIEKPFGVYISKAYLERNPGFMQQLNKTIRTLNTEP